MTSVRISMSFATGLLLTTLLFWSLAAQISGPALIVVNKLRTLDPIFTDLTVVDPPVHPPTAKPEPPETGGAGPGIKFTETHPVAPRHDAGRPTVPSFDPPPGTRNDGGTADTDARLIVPIRPGYPPAQAQKGVEGWVLIEFAVSATGAVVAPRVIDSQPSGSFDEAALQAIRRWLYSPKVSDGVAVEQRGVRAVLRFDLEE